LKAKGVTPLSVTEGGRELPVQSERVKSTAAILAVIALVVIGAVVALWVQQRAKPADVKPPKVAKIESKLRKPAADHPTAVTHVAPKKQIDRQNVPIVTVKPVAAEVTGAVTQTLPVTSAVLPSATETPAMDKPTPVFKSGTEQVLSWITNTRLGDAPPPLPNLPVFDNMEAILNSDIVLYDDDSKNVEEIKYNVAHAKQMLKTYIAQGGSPQDFLKYYHNELRKAHNEWMEAQKQGMELYRAGDEKGALTYYEEQNKALQDRGIKPLVIPPKLRNPR
jgi:hypothetical protein